MPCENCNVQFGIITRKKSCFECRRLFCKNCLEKRHERILCHNCLIFTKRPLSKVDLGQLKVKDLILYLQSKHISTSGCVEKDDLINLVIANANSTTNSPQSPTESTGSRNGRVFNFSAPSSTGGSSGGGQSGSSTRQGNFYTNSAENCANTFDQIKNTCQNLFSTFTDKLSSDVPKATYFGSRFTNVSAEENERPRNPPDEHVYQQPRFGSNDVYWVTGNQINDTESASELPTSGIVPNERNVSQTNNEYSDGSGITSGADSSANSSSVSSPAHQKPAPCVQDNGIVKLTLSERIDNMLASEENQNGCECSDEEGENGETDAPRRKESKKISADDNEALEAGPSQDINIVQKTNPESKIDTSSTPDEINPGNECIESLTTTETISSIDTEHRQEINNTDESGTTETGSTVATATTATMTETTDHSNEIIQSRSRSNTGSSQVARRRSDSFLLTSTYGTNLEGACFAEPQEPLVHSSQVTSTTGKCFKCGKRRSGIRKQLKKIRKMLDTSTVSETDKRLQLEAFLGFLEQRSKGSLELSEGESMSEEATSSMAEAEPMEAGLACGFAMPTTADDGMSSSCDSRQHTHYPRIDDGPREKNNVLYSAGNQQLASMNHIQLSDISESADLDVLSVKQLKKILVLNRVDFKGCCEKAELRERVLRLWYDYKSIASPERLAADDLCRICMDAPINCVILECGHMATCINCGKVLSECPICRQYIVRVVRSFKV